MYNILHSTSSSESLMSASARLNSRDDRILNCFRLFNPYALRHTYLTNNADLSNHLERLAIILWSMINSNPRNNALNASLQSTGILINLLNRTNTAEETFYSMNYRHQGSHYADRGQEISAISPVYDRNSSEITLNGFQQRVRLWLFDDDDNISDEARNAVSSHRQRCRAVNIHAIENIERYFFRTTSNMPSTPMLRG